MTHKEIVVNTAKELMLQLIQSNIAFLRLSARGGDEAVKELGNHFAALVSKVDASLKGIE